MSDLNIKRIEDMDDETLLRHLSAVKSRLESNNRSRHDTIRKCYQYYKSSGDYLKSKFKKDPTSSQYVSARPFQQVEVLKSFMLGNRPKLYQEYEQQFEFKSKEALGFLNSVVWGKDEINFEDKLDSLEGWRILGGTSITKVLWKRKFEKRTIITPAKTILGITVHPETKETQEVQTVNSPDVKVVIPMRFFVDPYIENIRDQSEVCEEIGMRYSDIMNNGKGDNPEFVNTEGIDDRMLGEVEENSGILDWRESTGVNEYNDDTSTSHDPLIKLEQWWLSPNWCITVIPDRLVLQRRQHEYEHAPYVVTKFIVDSGLFWGIGALEMLIPAFDEKNEYRNLRLALKKRFYGKIIAYDPKQLYNPEKDMVPKHSWIIATKGPPDSAIKIVDAASSGMSLLEEEGVIDREIELEGVPMYMAGTGTEEATETASGITSLQAAASQKFSRPRGRLEHSIEETVELICKFCNKHLIEGKEFYVNADGYLSKRYVDYSFFAQPDGESLFRIKVELGSTKPVNESSELQKWMIVKKMFNAPNRELDIELLNALGVKNPEKVVPQTTMIPATQAQQQAAQAFEEGKKQKVKIEVLQVLLKKKLEELNRGEEEMKQDDYDMEQGAEELKAKLGMSPLPEGENPENQELGQRILLAGQELGAETGNQEAVGQIPG